MRTATPAATMATASDPEPRLIPIRRRARARRPPRSRLDARTSSRRAAASGRPRGAGLARPRARGQGVARCIASSGSSSARSPSACSGSGSTTSGQEHLPRDGGYLLIAAAHRGWMDPFVAMHAIPARAARLVPRQRAVDVHLALARAAHPPARRPAAGLARRARRRRATSRPRGPWSATAPCSSRCPRARSADRAGRIGPFRHGGGADRPSHRCPDRAARDGRHRGALHRSPDGLAGAARDERGRAAGAAWPGDPAGSRAVARSSSSLGRVTAALEARLGPVVEALHPGTIDPPDASSAAAQAADVAPAPAGPARPDGGVRSCRAPRSPTRPVPRSCRPG